MMTDIKRLRKISDKTSCWYQKFEGFTMDNDGLMRYNNWIYVPPNDDLRSLILKKPHSATYMAHSRVTKMRENLYLLFLWKGIKEDIVNYIETSLECQQVKDQHRHPAGLIQPCYFGIEMGGHFDGFYCGIFINGKEA
jgi:hypothetical protein